MGRSKVVEAKLKQNYQDKFLARRCRECVHFRIKDDDEMFCEFGFFEVRANAVCDEFKTKETE